MAKQATTKTNPLEIASEMGKAFADIPKIAMEQIGIRKASQPSEITMGKQAQTLEIKLQKLEAQFHNTVIKNTQEVYNFEKEKEQQQIKQVLTNLAVEVKNIQSQAAALSGDMNKITVEQIPDPGKYHLNFFEWVLTMLRDIKKDIVKSRTWLSAFNSKKQKKGYWGMFKKHGMSFAMSDERSLATAAG
ncbi:MAG: DUF5660 domain-containing protein [bacterium]|nr:DUF5660 domain-containing protein [bacterium]